MFCQCVLLTFGNTSNELISWSFYSSRINKRGSELLIYISPNIQWPNDQAKIQSMDQNQKWNEFQVQTYRCQWVIWDVALKKIAYEPWTLISLSYTLISFFLHENRKIDALLENENLYHVLKSALLLCTLSVLCLPTRKVENVFK